MEMHSTRVKMREGAERLLMNLEPGFSPKTQRCASSHSCWIVGFGLILLHIKVSSAEGHYYQGRLNESPTALQAGSCTSFGELSLTWLALGSAQITSRLNSRQLFFMFCLLANLLSCKVRNKRQQFNKAFCIDFIVWWVLHVDLILSQHNFQKRD